MKVVWKSVKRQYGPNWDIGYVGKVKIFGLGWDKIYQEEEPYKLSCSLPGIKDTFKIGSISEGKDLAEKIWLRWNEMTQESIQ